MARPVSSAPVSASSRVVARIANVGLATVSSSRDRAAAERPMMCDLMPLGCLPGAAADGCRPMSSSRQDKRCPVYYVNRAYPINPFKPSGAKWLHYKVFKAILV